MKLNRKKVCFLFGVLILVLGVILFSELKSVRCPGLFYGVAMAAEKKGKTVEIIIDNSSTNGFTKKGDWSNDYGDGGDNYAGDSLWAALNEKGDDEALWTPDLPSDGYYEVYIWYCGDPNYDHATKAPFYVYTGKKKKEFFINLQENYGKWNLLGTFKMKKKDKNYVSAKSCASGNAIADAVKFVYIGKKKKKK